MRLVLSSLLIAALLGGVTGCGGATESEKKAAEKVPDLDISESTTADKTEGETKKP